MIVNKYFKSHPWLFYGSALLTGAMLAVAIGLVSEGMAEVVERHQCLQKYSIEAPTTSEACSEVHSRNGYNVQACTDSCPEAFQKTKTIINYLKGK